MQLPLSTRGAGFRGRANWPGPQLPTVDGLVDCCIDGLGFRDVNWKVTSLEVVFRGMNHPPPQETEHREKSPRLNGEGDM